MLAMTLNAKTKKRSEDENRRLACMYCTRPGEPGHESVTSSMHCPIANLVSPNNAARFRSARLS